VAEDGDPEARDEVLLEPPCEAATVDDGTLNWSVAGLRVSERRRRRDDTASLATNDTQLHSATASSAGGSLDDFPYVVWQLCSKTEAAERRPEPKTKAPAVFQESGHGRLPSKLICPTDYMLGARETKSPRSMESDSSCRKPSPSPPTPPPRRSTTSTTVYASGHVVANGSILGDAAPPQSRRELDQSFEDGRRRSHPAQRQSSLPDMAAVDPATPVGRPVAAPTVTEPVRRRVSGYHSDGVLKHRGRRARLPGHVAFVAADDSAEQPDARRSGRGRVGRRQQSVYQTLMESDELTAEQVHYTLCLNKRLSVYCNAV